MKTHWAIVISAVILAAIVGFMAYNAGVQTGIAQSGKIVTVAPPPGAYPAGAYPAPYPYYGWHRPWGFGFFFGPIFFILFWVFVLRAIFWGRRGCYDRGARYEEWHRRMHERMETPQS